VKELIPKNLDPALFIKYFTKDRSFFKDLETKYNFNVTPVDNNVLELQGKTMDEFDIAKDLLTDKIKKDSSDLYLEEVTVPADLHRYLVGKGGQNITKTKSLPIWEGRLLDLVVPQESSTSEAILVAVKKVSSSAAFKNEKELVAAIHKHLVSTGSLAADTVSSIMLVPQKYHGKIIGAGGSGLKELLSKVNHSTSIKFPAAQASDGDSITIKGPKNDVASIEVEIKKLIEQFSALEKNTSFADELTLLTEYGHKLFGPRGKDISWIFKAIREKFASGQYSPKDKFEKELFQNTTGLLHLNATLEEIDGTESSKIRLSGPKGIVQEAKKILQARLEELENSLTVEVNLFSLISSEAQSILSSKDKEFPRKIIRSLIGNKGEGLKEILKDFPPLLVKFSKATNQDEDVPNTESVVGMVTIAGPKVSVLGLQNAFVSFIEEKVRLAQTDLCRF
jgi:hypothetical protein